MRSYISAPSPQIFIWSARVSDNISANVTEGCVAMLATRRLLILLIAALGCTGCDQSTKYAAKAYLQDSAPISLINDLLRLTFVENHGGFLSFGASFPEAFRDALFLYAVPLILLLFVAYVLMDKRMSYAKICAAGIIVGGGASNLLDRILNDGYVTDFLNVGIGALRTGIFNVADMAVLFGALYLVITSSSRHAAQD